MAKVRGFVSESEVGYTVPDVAIYLMNKTGNIANQLATSNDDGEFEFEEPAANSVIQFSRAGYKPLYMNIGAFPFSGEVVMEEVPEASLDDLVLSSKPRKKPVVIPKPNYTLPIVLGCVSFVTICIWGYKKFV